MQNIRVLGIESSCDETAVAIYSSEQGVLAEALHSQIELHAAYGGVVPELASRDHLRYLPKLLQQALDEAQTTLAQIDLIAYTAGPGLMGALLAGASFAQGLAQASGKPVLPVHHMEGHLLAPMIEQSCEFPFLALLVSGGHSLLVACEALGQYKVLGETLDDAVGEAFDKSAQLLGLPYPGGPHLAALAQKGGPSDIKLPRPMTKQRSLMFSFSGLKTAVATRVQKADPADSSFAANLAYAFEEAVVETLSKKLAWAMESTGYKDVFLAGGVAANQNLRERLRALAERRGWRTHFPSLALCTDNAAMIAHVGALRAEEASRQAPVDVRARWSLEDLTAPSKGCDQ